MSDEPITAATHRFTGMFRPPWEPLLESFNSQHDAIYRRTFDDQPIYIDFDNCFGVRGYSNRADLRTEWLAGHFDVPQYEPKMLTPSVIVPLLEAAAQVVRNCRQANAPMPDDVCALEQEVDKFQ